MTDQLSEIDSMKFGEPEIWKGDIVVPLRIRYQGRGGLTPHYLTREKLEALQRGAENGIEEIDEMVEDLTDTIDDARGDDE